MEGDGAGGVHVQHGMMGLPGAFFNFEISPMLVVHSETRQSFAHFLTSCVLSISGRGTSWLTFMSRTCAVVGGVLTVASIVDSILFATGRALKKSGSGGGGGFGGKLM